jgi:hypothetical protein
MCYIIRILEAKYIANSERNLYFGDQPAPKLMKIPFILLCMSTCLAGRAQAQTQTYSTLSVSTTTPMRDALHICNNLAQLAGFRGIDYYKDLDNMTYSAGFFGKPTPFVVNARADGDKTILTFRLWHLKAVGGYAGLLETYSKKLAEKLDNCLIGHISKEKGEKPVIDSLSTSTDDGPDWSIYSITQTSTYSAGVFPTPALFRRNIAEPFDLDLTWRSDSVYELRLKDSPTEEETRLHESLKEARGRMGHYIGSDGRGLLCYQGKLYFIIQYPLCLPLEKAGDTFHFHIPRSFPNLKSLDLVNQEEAGPPHYTGNNNGNPLAVLAAALLFGIADEALKQQGEKSMLRKGIRDKTMRDCYFDLKTGKAKCM